MTVGACDVTVVIPTRDRAGFLSGALRSALSQVDVNYEVRVVDDASIDGTADLLANCLDARVTTVHHELPQGVAAARNRAVADANGEWLAFLDDDDLWAPTWLRTGLETARRGRAGAVYGSCWVVDGRRRVLGARLAPHPRELPGLLGHQNAIGGPSAVMVRADVLAAAGGFDERLSALADWDAWLRVLDICRAAPVPELLSAYTSYPDNMHVRDPFAALAEFASFARIVKTRAGAVGVVSEEGFTRWLALDSSRAGRRPARRRDCGYAAPVVRALPISFCAPGERSLDREAPQARRSPSPGGWRHRSRLGPLASPLSESTLFGHGRDLPVYLGRICRGEAARVRRQRRRARFSSARCRLEAVSEPPVRVCRSRSGQPVGPVLRSCGQSPRRPPTTLDPA